MKKETQEAIREAIVEWLSTHSLIKGEYEIIQRYMRHFYGISLFDINVDALVALWKKSEEEHTISVGVYGAEDFWDWIDIAAIELETEYCEEGEEEEMADSKTPFNIFKGNTYTYTPPDNVLLANSQEKPDIPQYKAPFTYTISGIPEKLVLTYELKESERIPMEKNK